MAEINQLIVKCVRSIPAQLPRSGVAKLLVGSAAGRVLPYKNHPLYGCLAGYSRTEILAYVDGLIKNGPLRKGDFGYIDLKPSAGTPILQTYSPGSDQHIQAIGKSDLYLHHLVELGETKSSDAVPELILALKSEDGNIRRLSASALGKIRDQRAVEPLIVLLSHERKHQVRHYVVKALGRIGDCRPSELLRQVAADKTEMAYTREAAKQALAFIKGGSSSPDLQVKSSIDGAGKDTCERLAKVENYLNQAHYRSLIGPWDCGWALDFHSQFNGAGWNRSRIGELTFRYKYKSDVSVLPVLIDYVTDLIDHQPDLGLVDAVVPVPPSQWREMDPVHIFCQALAEKMNIPFEPILVKSHSTLPQKEMKTLAQKRANIYGAFSIQGNIHGKRFLVVDDLFDSGATLEEVTRVLSNSGAKRVCVLTLTRTIHTDT